MCYAGHSMKVVVKHRQHNQNTDRKRVDIITETVPKAQRPPDAMSQLMDQSVSNDDVIGSHMDTAMMKTFNYVVDYICAKRVGRNGKVEYLVKWEGWDGRHSTWETIDNFASARVVDIFEMGLSEQMGDNRPVAATSAATAAANGSADHSTARKKSGNRATAAKKSSKSKPLAAKLVDDMRRKKTNGALDDSTTAGDLFGALDMSDVIRNYEKLMGASKRKSSRMSCPSTPVKSPKKSSQSSSSSAIDTLRSQRYRMREELKSKPFNECCLSVDTSNGSHEENKNPLSAQYGAHCMDSQLTAKSAPNAPIVAKSGPKKHKIRVNTESNKMVSELSGHVSNTAIAGDTDADSTNSATQQSSPEAPVAAVLSPTKQFLNKVKHRLKGSPELYGKFLNEIIEFKEINAELSRVLIHADLIQGLLEILLVNRRREDSHTAKDKELEVSSGDSPSMDETIGAWKGRVEEALSGEQSALFWEFLQRRDKREIVKASPDVLWLKINKMFDEHRDLSDEFRKFMPNLCSYFYAKSCSNRV